jgi:type IV secretory pathway VirD2 relaxase
VPKDLLEDWDLDVHTHRIGRKLSDEEKRRTPKLVHNIVLSMPKATDGQKVLAAAKAFAREQFALKQRYAMVLHTDTKHPHVHLVVKAESEEGKRLYIRKATLRQWRLDFARHLSDQGLVANATARALRGRYNSRKPDGLHRADMRGVSTHMRTQVREALKLSRDGKNVRDAGKDKLEETRREVMADWKRTLGTVIAQGQHELAARIARFIRAMSPVQTEREAMIDQLTVRTRPRDRGGPSA